MDDVKKSWRDCGDDSHRFFVWIDVFDAMVTGDLMEYPVHGSTHGGSSHGGSFHGGSFNTASITRTSGSIHGFLTISCRII
jgi:hypothetical protein